MILYVNGDSHTAAAEAVTPYAFAKDDDSCAYMGDLPHPDNLAVSWGKLLSDVIKATFKCDAISGASNDRILRTTRQFLDQPRTNHQKLFVVIQWSTWERSEWEIDGKLYQINASGQDWVPESHQQAYREWVLNLDQEQCKKQAHETIWNFHVELQDLAIPHVFFNGDHNFWTIPLDQQRDWGASYINPYNPVFGYSKWLIRHGFQTVSPKSYHFGQDAHAAWSQFVLKWLITNKMI